MPVITSYSIHYTKLYDPRFTNTIDAEAPESSVESLTAVTDTSNFAVTWTNDDFGGSDARAFTLSVSEGGAPFEIYRTGIANTSTVS